MKIIWHGHCFNATGIATANREMIKALVKQGHKVQCSDIWHSGNDFNTGLEFLNNSIDPKNEDTITIFADYPQYWQNGFGKLYGFFLHEGTRLFPGWAEKMNMMEKVFVPSIATKNLFKWNGVMAPIVVVPYGVNPEIYKPKAPDSSNEFMFLSVNSWNLKDNDRKGISLLIRAFDEEFKGTDAKLFLKISTFYRKVTLGETALAMKNILGHDNPNILINTDCLSEEKLADLYNACNCFVMPTHGESFGLTAINAMACGTPIIITKDSNSGYMDFCKGKDSVLFIDAPKMEQADLTFFVPGNFQSVPELDSLKKQMRYAYEHKDLKEKALKNSEDIRLNWTWDESARKLIEAMQ